MWRRRSFLQRRFRSRFPRPWPDSTGSSIRSRFSRHTRPRKEMAVLGPFMVADYKPGATVLLKRNPNYWKTDAQGRKLPYLDSIQLDIQPNRDVEMLRFKRGEIDLINSLDSEYFDKLAATSPQLVHDAGRVARQRADVVQRSEQVSAAGVQEELVPVGQFPARDFRGDQSRGSGRVVFRGHAQPAVGPVSPANKFWFNAKLKARGLFARCGSEGSARRGLPAGERCAQG